MTRTWRGYRRLAVPALVLAAGCGAQLEAVEVTGAAGQRLAAEDQVLAAVPALCLEIASLSGASDDCSALRDQARAWTRVVTLVEAYANALSHLAANNAGITPDMLPVGFAGGAWTGLKPEEAAAATALAGVTRELETHHHDAAALRKALSDADGPIQTLAQAIDGAVDRRIASIDLAETSIDVVRQRLQETVSAPVPARRAAAPSPAPAAAKHPDKTGKVDPLDVMLPALEAVGNQLALLRDEMVRQAVVNQAGVPGSFAGLAAVQNDLESKRQRFEKLREALDAFAKAHKALHDNLDQIETEGLFVKVLGIVAESGSAPPTASAAPRPPQSATGGSK